MNNLPIPTLHNLLSKEGSTFQIQSTSLRHTEITREGNSTSMSSESDSESDGNRRKVKRMEVAKGRMPWNVEDDSRTGRNVLNDDRDREESGEVGSPGSEKTEKGSSTFGSTNADAMNALIAKSQLGGNGGPLTTKPGVGIAPNNQPGQPVKVIVVADVVRLSTHPSIRENRD